MSAAAGYSNELEQYFGELPGWLQAPLGPIFREMDKWLKAVAGKPEDLLRARDVYTGLAQQVQQLADDQKADRARLQGRWDGPAYKAFTAKMEQIEQQIGKVSQALSNTPEVLESCAKALVEGANAIVQIVLALIGFLITQFVVNAVLDVLTLGANIAAQIAEAIATCLAGLARVISVVERIATVLAKVASIFEKIADIMRDIKLFLETFKAGIAITKDLSKEAGLLSKSGLALKGLNVAGQAVVMQGANPVVGAATGGKFEFPGGAGELLGAGGDYYNALHEANKAKEESAGG